jgi:hypothetical protein
LVIDRPLAPTKASIAPSTITSIKATEFPWIFVPKVILWFQWCQHLQQFQWSSLAAIDFGDFISGWGSMAAVDLWGWGDRSAFGGFEVIDRSKHHQRHQDHNTHLIALEM